MAIRIRGYQDQVQDKVAVGEGFGAGSVTLPSWPGVSRPSTPHRRSADGRDTPGHDESEKIFHRRSADGRDTPGHDESEKTFLPPPPDPDSHGDTLRHN